MIYYCLLTTEQLNSLVPQPIISYMGYPDGEYILKDCIFGEPVEQEDGRWLCDCRLRTWDYTEVWGDGVLVKPALGISNNCTNRYLTEDEVEMWGQYIGTDNIIELV